MNQPSDDDSYEGSSI